jgi:hypothetical protein
LLSASGCGSGTVPVQGSVQREGQVIAGGKVVFSPVEKGKIAFGAIQPDGSFQLTTARPHDGALAGKYRVMIAGQHNAEDQTLHTTYLGPSDEPLEVVAGQENNFTIDVREQNGWQAVRKN